MTNKLYKFLIDAPTTAEKCKSLLLPLDKGMGSMFRIEKMWIQGKEMDAMIAGDLIGIQVSLQSQNENAALLDIDSEYEIFTYVWKIHLAEATNPGFDDPNKCLEVPGIEGTLLECNKKNYLTAIQIGAGAADQTTRVKILGQYVSSNVDDWNYNTL